MRRTNKNKNAGLTLLELMISLAVVAIIISVSVPGFSDFRQTQRLVGAAEQVQSHLQQARSESIARSTETYVHFSADGSSGWIYGISSVNSLCDLSATSPTATDACVLVVDDGDGVVDPGDGSVDSDDLVLMRYSGDDFEDVTMSIDFSSGNAQIEFEPVRGMANTGQIDLTAANGDQLRVRVTRLGRVSMCAPGGSVAQYSSAGC